VAIPVHVQGSQINLHTTRDQQSLYRVVNAEISQPDLAIEFLAANLERGVYRARREGVPVTWQALAAWHNQGIVRPADIKANPTARHYIHRASAYRATAAALLAP
jgi:hypothetical protein